MEAVLPEFAAGHRVGEFVVERPLGRGSTSVVYVAHFAADPQRRVALKLLSTRALEAGDRARFEREAQLLARLDHPHLIRVLGHGEAHDSAVLYLASRLVDGPTLAEVLHERCRAGPGDAEVRRELARRAMEVADALAQLHARGFVHRDVKPANVALQLAPHAAAVLLDFGLARRCAGEASTAAALTLPYAAPEVLQSATLDPRSDVFSLGVTLHDLLAAREPSQRRARQLFGLEPLEHLVPAVERDLAAIVARATALDPARRYAEGGALRNDLRRWLDGSRPRAAIDSRSGDLRRAIAVAGLPALLVALLALCWRADRLGGPAKDDGVALARERVGDAETERAAGGCARDLALAQRLRELETAVDPLQRRERKELLVQLARRFVTPRPLAASAASALRDALERQLPQLAGDEALFAASALGGCGDLDSARCLAAWMEAAATRTEAAEPVRLALSAISAIVAEGRHARADWSAAAAEWAGRHWERFVELAARVEPTRARSLPPIGEPLTELLAELAYARRERAAPPPAIDAGPFEFEPRWRCLLVAARGDSAAFAAALAEFERTVPSDEPSRREAGEWRGRFAGALGDEATTQRLRAIAAGELFERGIELEQHRRRATRTAAAPPPRVDVQGFARDFTTRSALLRVAMEGDALRQELPFAWDFRRSPRPGAACDANVLAIDAGRVANEGYVADSPGHLLLDIAGRSAVELSFRADDEARAFELRLSMQKEGCARLPWSGSVRLTARLDGEPVAEWRFDDLGVKDDARCTLTPPPAKVEQRHRLRLELAAESTVGVRIEQIHLARKGR